MCRCDKNSGKEIKGDEDMSKTTLSYPDTRKPKVLKALKEVEMIRKGKLPKKSARDFLEETKGK